MEISVYEDCMILIDKFIDSGDTDYTGFCKQWNLMTFQYLWSAQTTNIEVMQTTAAALHAAKRIACGRHWNGDIQLYDNDTSALAWRLGGIYLMYTIYFKQPTKQFVKIEVSPKTWNELTRHVQSLEASTSEGSQMRYIFEKLLQSQAFRFTALDYCVGLEGLINYDEVEFCGKNKGHILGTSTNLKHTVPKLTEAQKMVPGLNVLEERYNEMKKMLGEASKTNTQSLPPIKIFSELSQVFKNIDDVLSESSVDTSNLEVKVEERDKRELKRKAYLNEAMNDKKNADNSTKDSTEGRQRRMSAHTIFANPLPEDILKDLEMDDTEDA